MVLPNEVEVFDLVSDDRFREQVSDLREQVIPFLGRRTFVTHDVHRHQVGMIDRRYRLDTRSRARRCLREDGSLELPRHVVRRGALLRSTLSESQLVLAGRNSLRTVNPEHNIPAARDREVGVIDGRCSRVSENDGGTNCHLSALWLIILEALLLRRAIQVRIFRFDPEGPSKNRLESKATALKP